MTGSNQLGQVSLASGSTISIGNAAGGVAAATGVGGVPGAARGAGVTEAALGVLPADMQVGRVTGTDAHGQASLAPAGSTSIANASGTAAQAAGLGGVPGQTRLPGIAQVALTDASGRAQFVRTSSPSTALPNASLFRTLPSLSSRYLVETDPRFANFREWTGSEYLLNQVKVDPSVTQKRLGDGFYEQKLVREQVAQLTGQRFVGDYTNDEQQYRALMDAGVAYAKNYDLHPGVALTAEQMAALTSDIVWLVERDVALPDGSVQKALVPQIYLRLREGDLDGSGALLAGKDININLSGDLTNSGTIAGRSVVKLTADNVENMGGRLNGDAVAVAARNDLNNIGGTISANSELIATAGRDIHIASTTQSASSSAGGNSFSRTDIDRVAGLYVTGDGSNGGGTLVVSAGRDVSMLAGVIGNAGKDGQTIVNAGRDIKLETLTTASSSSLSWDAKNYRKDSSSTEIGSQIQGSGSIVLQAGNDLIARAADVQAGAGLSVTAGHDIVLSAGTNQLTVDEGHVQTGKGFLNKKTITTRDMLDLGTSAGSAFGGATVAFAAGNDIKLTGAQILSDGSASLLAKNDISIGAASETSKELHHRDVKESGFMSGGGFGFSYGTRTTTTDQERDAVIQSGQARSTVGSTSGALTIVAGKDLKIGGSDIVAATDLNLAGTSVKITPGQDSDKGKFETKTTQDGFTVALGGSVVSAIQTLQTMSTAASTAKNSRVTAMAAATAAMAAKDAAKDMMKEGGPSISISLTAGHSESQQTQTTASTTHSGSVLTGNNINITATGGGKESNITILGSDLNAKNDIRLHADNNVNLLAAQDTESQHSKSSSVSASVGVQAIVSTKGTSFGFTASVSGSKGHEDGDGTTQLNTHVNAGDKLVISSGGDTNIKGAVASANQVIADIKGNLNLESLQDTAKFDSKSQSISASGTVGFGASVSGSYSQSNMHNDYASVQEQSGIKAGDGGFQIKVGGNTDLKGAVISATEAGKLDSSLITATLTHSDIANHAISKGSSVGVSGGMSFAGTGTKNDNLTNVGGERDATTKSLPSIVALSENASSTTRSGISGGTLVITDDAAQHAATGKGADEAIAGVNRDVTTGVDSSGKIGNNFDKAKLQATMDVTAAFAAAAAEKLGTYASDKLKEATVLADEAFRLRETDPERSAELTRQSDELTKNWKEDGLARVALHTAIGGLAGGANGALGAGAAALSTDSIAKQLKQLDMPETLRDALTLAAGAAVGAAAGGATGAASAANEVANNYLKHEEILEKDKLANACWSGDDSSCEKGKALAAKSAARDAELLACKGVTSAACESLFTEARRASVQIAQEGPTRPNLNYLNESDRTFDMAYGYDSTPDTSFAGLWAREQRYGATNSMSLLNPNTSTVGGWLGDALKNGYESVVYGTANTVRFLVEGAANANHIERMGRSPEVSPSSPLGKFVADDQIPFGEKLLMLGRAPLDAMNGVLKGDPGAVGSVVAGWVTGKLLWEAAAGGLPRNNLAGNGAKTSTNSAGVDSLKVDSVNVSERGLGSTSGHQFTTVIEGGSGQALAGHGVMESNATILGNGQYVSPPGTTVITPRPGIKIADSTGQILENVKSVEHLESILNSGVGPNGQILVPRNFVDLEGYNVVSPGQTGFNYTLLHPAYDNKLLNIFSKSTTTDIPTHLSIFLEPNMGCVFWAACTQVVPFIPRK